MKNLPEDLERLVTEGGFATRKDLLSLALAIGVFNGKKGKGPVPVGGEDIERLSSYTLSALIVADGMNRELTIEQMRTELREYLSGGLSMILDRVKGRSGIEALEEVARMIPL